MLTPCFRSQADPSGCQGAFTGCRLCLSRELNGSQRRLDLFIGGRYAASNLSSVMYKDRCEGPKHFKMEMWSAPERSKPTFEEAKAKIDGGAGKPVERGIKFGPSCE